MEKMIVGVPVTILAQAIKKLPNPYEYNMIYCMIPMSSSTSKKRSIVTNWEFAFEKMLVDGEYQFYFKSFRKI